MSSINDIMKTMNKTSLFGQVSPESIRTAKSERQEAEKRMREHKMRREEEQRQYREDEERKRREDEEFDAREYEKYLEKYANKGILQRDNRILQNEQHVRSYVNHSGEGGIYSNRVQAEIWQPGPAPRYTQFDCYAGPPAFTFRPVGETSSGESLAEKSPASSPTFCPDDFPSLLEAAPPVVCQSTVTRPRRSRIAANFTNRPAQEPFVEPGVTPRCKSWRDAPAVASINDLRPDRRVIGLINAHLSSAQDEFKLRKDDFPPIGGRPGQN